MLLRHTSMNKISLLSLFILLIAYMTTNVQCRLYHELLVGGESTSLNEIPYQVSIRMLNLIDVCGGAIIDEQFILTAAHCIIGSNNEFLSFPISIVAGINDLENANLTTKVEVKVETAYVPNLYNGSLKVSSYDIAVLKLKTKLNLELSDILKAIDLPSSTEGEKLTENNSYEKTEALVTGFGWNRVWFENVTENNVTKKIENGDTDGKLLKAKTWILPNFQCKLYVPSIHDTQLCAQIIQHSSEVHQGVCSADSGGPLVVNNTIVGVISYSWKGCNDSQIPAVYTRVSAYINFIDKAFKNVTDGARITSW